MKHATSRMAGALWLVVALVVSQAGLNIPAYAQGPDYSQAFDDPAALSGWQSTPEVAISGGVLRVPAPGFVIIDLSWADFNMSVWVQRYGEGDVLVMYRSGAEGYYAVRIGAASLSLQRVVGDEQVELATAPAAIPAAGWFNVSVLLAGAEHVIALNHQPVLTASDQQLSAGSVGFRVEGAATADFDDLVIMASGAPLPADAAPPADSPQPPANAVPPAAEASDTTAPVAAPAAAAPSGECTQTVTPGGLAAAIEAAQPGAVICAAGGDYTAEGELIIAVSGTADQPITIMANGDPATVEAFALENGASHLRIHGFIVYGFGVWGVTLNGNNEDISLTGLDIGGGETGIRLTYDDGTPVNNITIADSVIHDMVYAAVDCTPGPCNNLHFQRVEAYGAGMGSQDYASDALSIEMGSYILIEDCYLHDNSGDGIDLNSRDAGPVPGIVVRRNRVINHNANGIKLWNGGEISNNLVVYATVLLVTEPGDYTIVNNTFANNREYDYMALLGGADTTGPATLRLYNNIFYNDEPAMGGTIAYFASGVQLEGGHNLYYNPYREEDVICAAFLAGGEACFNRDQINDGTWAAQAGGLQNILYADPVFVDPANGDYHLAAGSPAIDAGFAGDWLPLLDLDGTARPAGAGPDLGAYEAGS
ncbi:MAG: right-handed parallel beta-helix repeat-containing protein [Anaerolineae bacterium]|nr:right-handed parallel beta-helix repeat-containing protein [Anaerolineae bacterium]